MQAKRHLPRSLASPVHLDPATAFDTDWKDIHHDIVNLVKKEIGQTYFKIGFKTIIVILCFLACAGESLLSGASQTRKAQEGLSKRERDSNSAVSRSGDCRRLRRGGRLAFAINNIASPRPPLPLPPPHPYITHLRLARNACDMFERCPHVCETVSDGRRRRLRRLLQCQSVDPSDRSEARLLLTVATPLPFLVPSYPALFISLHTSVCAPLFPAAPSSAPKCTQERVGEDVCVTECVPVSPLVRPSGIEESSTDRTIEESTESMSSGPFFPSDHSA